MLIAHAPSGYLLARVLSRFFLRDEKVPAERNRLYRRLMAAGVMGSIFPDFDFIYHIFIDSARTPHHSYLTHLPFFWLAAWLCLAGVGSMLHNRRWIAVSTMFCLGALLHLALDTCTGVIYWFLPLSGKGINVFKVADIHLDWIQNFTHHWTFLFEIAIILVAMAVYLRVKETVADIVHAFGRHKKLRELSLRLTVCAVGICIVALVTSMKFDIDNRALAKAAKMKRNVAGIFHR